MATQSKAQFLNDVLTHLKKRYKPKPERNTPKLTVLEAVVFGICHENATRDQATEALARYKSDFFDWNEVRVSTLEEIQAPISGLSTPEERAHRIRRFLRQLFEKTYGFTLEALGKKPLKDSVKTLQEYEALTSDYVLASVIQYALGGHAIPIDAASRRALERLGVADKETDTATLRGAIERAIPKNRAQEFLELIEELANDTCVEGIPNCPECELRKVCPTALSPVEDGQEAKATAVKVAKEGKDGKESVKAAKAAAASAPPKAGKEDSAAAKASKGKPSAPK